MVPGAVAAEWVPRLRPGLERHRWPEGGAALSDPASGRHARVAADQLGLLDAMDGTRDLGAVALAAAAEGHGLSPLRLLDLVGELSTHGMLEDQPVKLGVPAALERARVGVAARVGPWLGTALALLPLPSTGKAAALLAGLSGVGIAVLIELGVSVVPGHREILVGGSYALGVLALWSGASVVLSTRALASAAATAKLGQPIDRAGVELLAGVPALALDTRHAVRAGPAGELRVAATALWGGLGASLVLLAVARAFGGPAWTAAAFGGLAAAWIMLCPFQPLDLGHAFDLSRPGGEGRLHAMSYLHRRIFRRQGSGEFFPGEEHHLAFAAAVIAWLGIGFAGSRRFLVGQVGAAVAALTGPSSTADAAVAAAVVFVAGAVLLGIALAIGWRILSVARGHLARVRVRTRPMHPDPEGARRALSCCPVLAHLDAAAIERLADVVVPVEALPGDLVVRQGDRGDRFFVIGAGEALVFRVADSGAEEPLATLSAGDGFGEIALLHDEPRNASVRAVTRVVLFGFDRAGMEAALSAAGVSPAALTGMLRAAQAIRRSPVFAHLAPPAVSALAGRLRRESRPAGSVLMRQDDPGDRFYVVESGRLTVTVAATPTPVATLGPGDFVGEIALLSDAPRTATVACTTDVIALSLDRAAFREVVARDLVAGARLERTARERLGRRPG